MTNHITYKQVDAPSYLVLPAVPKMQVPELQEWSRGFRKAMSSPLYDETKVMGVKSYENEDFRSIHWSATAKTGAITAKSMSERNQINMRFISTCKIKVVFLCEMIQRN